MLAALNNIKEELEKTILHFDKEKYENGLKAKEGYIRSKALINCIHEAVKRELISKQVYLDSIFPPLGKTAPELKIAGFLKQKDQDVCVVPKKILRKERKIDWGPLLYENKIDPYGQEYIEQSLIINIRSQLSSLIKNADTLFERTFAEAFNIHLIYPNAVLGEVYLIPVYEYDDQAMKGNKVIFKESKTNLEKYISFFTALNNRAAYGHDESKGIIIEAEKYEKIALLIVDFSKSPIKLYNSTEELKEDKLVNENFSLELEDLSFNIFIKSLLEIYEERFNILNIKEK